MPTTEILLMLWSGFVFLMMGYMAVTEEKKAVKITASLLMVACVFIFGVALTYHVN